MPRRPAVTFSISDIPNQVIAVTGEIRAIRFPEQGQVSDLACVEASNGSFALKRIRRKIEFLEDAVDTFPPSPEMAEEEYRVLRVLAPLGLPLPSAHALVHLGVPPDDEAWVVMDALPGNPLKDGEESPALMRSLGRALAKIHRCPVPAGWSGGGGDPFAWRVEMIEGWIRDAERTPGREKDIEELRSRLRAIADLRAHEPAPVPPTVIHGELNYMNILVVGTEVSGIVDWTGGGVGDPRQDVANVVRYKNWERFDTDELVLALFEGYGTPPPARDVLTFFWRLGGVLWGELES